MSRKTSGWLAATLVALALAPIWAPTAPTADSEVVGMSSEGLERLTATLAEYVESDQIAGSVAIVLRRGQVAYLEAFGMRDREASAPMAVDSIFRIASQTKALTSVCVMILQERGQLLITDPIAKYLPEFRDRTVAVDDGRGGYDLVPAERPITILDHLRHTSGISYGNGPGVDLWKEAGVLGWYFANRDEPIRDTVARMGALPGVAQPGERWVYGYNADILGALVEVVSGRPLDVFLREEVLEPLGMSDTHFYLPEEKRDRLATVYSSITGGGIERAPDPGYMEDDGIFGTIGQGQYVDGPRKSFSGGAGLLSTARDYAAFLQMMLNGGELNGVRILSPGTVTLMTVNQLDGVSFQSGRGFGLGFSVVIDAGARGIPGSVGEFGWAGAYHSTYWVDPEEELVAVYLTQLIPAIDIDDQDAFRALLYEALVE
ncbi:MAG: serine hydrolase [Acidobacteria bacterium]|nr:serine hydrolase [Acidobacteriota bacterium]